MVGERDKLQYVLVNLNAKGLEQINQTFLEFKHLLHIDLGKNNIVDVNLLQNFENVVTLNLAKNKIKKVDIFTNEELFPKLRKLDISENKYVELPAIKLPKLEYLDVGGNKLEKINDGWAGHPNLKVLKAEESKFKTLAFCKEMPKLEELYLGNNSNLTTITGYENIPSLKKLHLKKCKIENIEEELTPLENLEYINLRQNKISSFEVFCRLFQFPALKEIDIIKTPLH